MNNQTIVSQTYSKVAANLKTVRRRLSRSLTLSEKLLFGHLHDHDAQALARGQSYLLLKPDRVAMQDVSAQMALLQFMLAERTAAEVPTTIHCDHLIQAHQGAEVDLPAAKTANEEIYEFLQSASDHYGLEFWKPGSGIIHQVILENYAFPGGLLIGTDSHTANAGGLGMLASGVGGSEAAEVMAGMPWEVKQPKVIGVHLTGKLGAWTSAKDVILKLCGMLTTKGGTDAIIEYFGDGAASLSCTGKATIANMGAEVGATGSIFPFDEKMANYLITTERANLATLAFENIELLTADSEVLASPSAYFDEVYEINLTTLEPHIVGPHSPDRARPLSQLAKEAHENGWPLKLSAALIGSCTNSSYEDIGRAASIARQASTAGISTKNPLLLSPGSTLIRDTIERDGFMKDLANVGATVLANACGPCIGQWKRDGTSLDKPNVILTTFNRNFRGRNDGNRSTLSFIASPEIVMALTLAGRLDFNPMSDTIATPQGELRLEPPASDELPKNGFFKRSAGVIVRANSQRLERLEPFAPWQGADFIDQLILAKIHGQCTTDHISPAGPWLRFRGHLSNISKNLLGGATNAFTSEIGEGKNLLNGKDGFAFADVARAYQAAGQGWVIIGDENYGEGSSREHAAMSARHLGCTAVIAKSFARIHESNLKKQGLLALTFSKASDYELLQETDRVTVLGLKDLAPGRPVIMRVTHINGESKEIALLHSYNREQLAWFQAGSALSSVRR